MAASADMSDLNSSSASSSGVMPSPPPPPFHERPWPGMRPSSPGAPSLSVSPSPSPSSSPSSPAPPPGRTAKNTSKAVSKARQCDELFTSVAASAYLRPSRSSRGMCWTASAASRCSVSETGSPERRSSVTKPERRSSTAADRSVRRRRQELFGRPLDVGLVLQQDVQGVLRLRGVDRLHAEQDEGARPVERLGHRRRLAQLERAQRAHDACHLVGELLADARHLGPHDLALALEVGVVDVQVQAAPLERFGELAGVVGRQEHHRQLRRPHGPELGDRHLVLGEDLEQQGLRLELDAVDLVDEEDDGLGGADGLEQRPGQQEVLREDVLLQLGPARALFLTLAVLPGLNPEQLLAVVPLVERLGLVEALVALQPDEPCPG